MSDPFDTYGEDIAGQSYASFGETRGDSGGGDNNEDSVKRTTIRTTDPTVGFDREPPPSERLNLISRIGGGAIQGIKDYFGDPSNRTGIVSSLIGTALLGPLAGLISGVVGQRFGAGDNLLQGINTIELDDNFLMPRNVPVNIKRDIPNFPPDMNLYANKPFDYRIGDISDKTFDAAINSGFNPYTGEELKPGEAEQLQDQRDKQGGITTTNTTMTV